ncbi:MAG: hypothetical protein A2408_04050 [Candidatus Yonathbacteria bacterium RIFOXYC1_FULL_52_10]|uniref:Uncharacterized protein n=1 Tax=Candidatus Yonathbacteria bacterium RIFOXYD1_FULL_52_36 TaxID=1802730 RepID=A0A1G2SJB1_9BACT|nr:MAG: hypothetical protein A2408_04050 [Candidatus Yonathbacteria bacterium RIFOXYC1_FULL_52_10]OHA85074.1 MAG: hypothetical protein A2591_01945 [Candidatus Yonathbacteria bacterium RIFOXYD1_FULL_52_36]
MSGISLATSVIGSGAAFARDFLIVIILAVVFAVYGVRKGKDDLTAVMIAMLLGYAAYAAFVGTDLAERAGVSGASTSMIALGAFAVFTVAAYRASARYLVMHWSSSVMRKWTEVTVFAVVAAGLTLALLYQVLYRATWIPQSVLAESARGWFADPTALFGWVLATLVTLVVLGRGR